MDFSFAGCAKSDSFRLIRILCNAHPDMEAFIVVKEHPFFSSADKGGNYRLDGVPLGKYRIQVWHPELGTTEAGAELVRAGEVLDVNFRSEKEIVNENFACTEVKEPDEDATKRSDTQESQHMCGWSGDGN